MSRNEMGWDVSKKPRMFIQWKGTYVCMDFHCTCGNSFHIDEDFVYAVKCLNCGKVWELGSEVAVKQVTKAGKFENITSTGDQEPPQSRGGEESNEEKPS